MKHLILSLLILGFSQSLQAKLNINPPSESISSHSDKDSQKELITNSQVKDTSQKTNPTVSVDNPQKQSERIPANKSDQQILSTASFCIANFTRVSEQFSGYL